MVEPKASGRGTGRARKSPAKARRAPANKGTGARRDQEVLEAATKVFHARGYADASVQDIADELGILKGSLYHYIDSKEELLFRLLDESHQEVAAILEEVLAIEGLEPLERLRLYVTRQVEYTSKNLAKMAIYYHDVDQLSEERRKEVLRNRRTHERFVASLIAEAQERGEVPADLDPALTTNYLFGSMIWVYRWYRPGGKLRPQQVAATCADFIMGGLTAPR
ncbi:MAG: TetR/AcrR family transcriptional regulator [Solirubrobacterales bacterium]|nr:TetR/AcrR family transcriptional regulator [Solirubrobacterales bacterium]